MKDGRTGVTYILLGKLHGGIAVGVGDLGLLAQAASDHAVHEPEDGDGAQRHANHGTERC